MEKKTKNIATVIVVAAIAIVSVYTIYDLNGNSLDLSDREVRIIVTGSMDGNVTQFEIDSFPANTLVMIKHLNQDQVASDLKVGDVIAFNYSGKLLTHRIISINESAQTITTQGDANAGTETFSYTKVVGIIVGTNHPLGIVVHVLQHYTISVILATVGIVSASVAVNSSLKIMREEKEEEARKQQEEQVQKVDGQTEQSETALSEQERLDEERRKLEEERRQFEEEKKRLQESQKDQQN